MHSFDVADFLHNLVGHCVDLLNVEAAGLLVTDRADHLQVLASSSERTRVLQLFELQTNTGPCVECFETGAFVSAHDLDTAADRWPLFAERAARDGFQAVHALPMRVGRSTIGVLNLLTAAPGALTKAELGLAWLLTDVTTVVLLHQFAIRQPVDFVEQLQVALSARALIERAKGLVAEAGSLDMDEAFARMRTYARGAHVRLADVAQQLVANTLEARDIAQPGTGSTSTAGRQAKSG